MNKSNKIIKGLIIIVNSNGTVISMPSTSKFVYFLLCFVFTFLVYNFPSCHMLPFCHIWSRSFLLGISISWKYAESISFFKCC